jgi:hypothetical protein
MFAGSRIEPSPPARAGVNDTRNWHSSFCGAGAENVIYPGANKPIIDL